MINKIDEIVKNLLNEVRHRHVIWSCTEDILWFDKSMHKLCYMYVGKRTYYPKLKWDVLLFILTLCEGSQLPWWLGFEGLLPELCKNKPTSPTVLGLKPSSSFKIQ
jgi:hypothetical protein